MITLRAKKLTDKKFHLYVDSYKGGQREKKYLNPCFLTTPPAIKNKSQQEFERFSVKDTNMPAYSYIQLIYGRSIAHAYTITIMILGHN